MTPCKTHGAQPETGRPGRGGIRAHGRQGKALSRCIDGLPSDGMDFGGIQTCGSESGAGAPGGGVVDT